jgi:hypothetical protein
MGVACPAHRRGTGFGPELRHGHGSIKVELSRGPAQLACGALDTFGRATLSVMLARATRPSGSRNELATGRQGGHSFAQVRKHQDLEESPTSSADRAVFDVAEAPRAIFAGSWQRRLRLLLCCVRLIPSAIAVGAMLGLPGAVASMQPPSAMATAPAEHKSHAPLVVRHQSSLDEPERGASLVSVIWTTIVVGISARFGVDGPAGMKTTLGQA